MQGTTTQNFLGYFRRYERSLVLPSSGLISPQTSVLCTITLRIFVVPTRSVW